jgi:topoisomerase-4 subunit A
VVEQKVVDEPVTVIISRRAGCARTGHGHDATQFTFKAGDSLYGAFECRTVDNLLAFGSNGRVYTMPVNALPNARGDGVPVTTLIELASGSSILHYFAGPADTTLLLASDAAAGFIAKASDMFGRVKGGKASSRSMKVRCRWHRRRWRPTPAPWPASRPMAACWCLAWTR